MALFFLLLIWFCFIILFSYAEESNNIAYLHISSIVLFLIFYTNTLKTIRISLKTIFLLLSIPSFIFWYVFITYNYFLRVQPIPYGVVVFVMFTYFYIFIHLLSEHTNYAG